MDLGELAAREAVRDLIARYNANADSGRFDEVVELFAPDAVLELPGDVHEGRTAIAAMFRSVRERVVASAPSGVKPHLRHFTATLQIDVDDADHARSRCYFAVLMPHGLDHWGTYVDDFVRSDGTWRFARRRVTTDGRREGGSALD
ncbi:MAG TPA: nuclear transport factor 2 family protein [Acidimicrobiia bacterium]|jgi:uncharacterized protein (TIGR02246 family)